jgi:hypothetical protein
MNYRFLLLFVVFVTTFTTLHATHIVGGEMRYESLGYDEATQTGTYKVSLTVYRDCYNGVPPFDNPAIVAAYAGDDNSTFFDLKEMLLLSQDTIPLISNNICKLAPQGLCFEIGKYEAIFELPYNAAGYYFTYQRCCRNGIVNNLINPLDLGATYFVFMSGAAQLAANSSPQWGDYPPAVICFGQPLIHSNGANDLENDQIEYSFCAPSLGGDMTNPIPNPPVAPPYANPEYELGYSAEHPMQGNPQVTINPSTGLITGTPDHMGHFVIGVCGRELRNGVLMSEFSRDFEFVVSSCNQTIMQTSLTNAICDTATSEINFLAENGVAPYSYVWNTGETTQNLSNVTPGIAYTVTITDANDCTNEVTVRGNDCVWPGDANYDGVADIDDVLTIGLFYGDNGPQRPNATTFWEAEPAYFWSSYQTTGANTKHIDTNGSGSIDVFDVDAVNYNYSFTHPTAFHGTSSDAVPLTLSFSNPDVPSFTGLNASIDLGSASNIVSNVYGIAFSIVCDQPDAIDVASGYYTDLSTSIFAGERTINLTKISETSKQIDFVICNTTRMAMQPIYGNIVNLTFFFNPDFADGVVHFSLENIHLINENGETKPVIAQNADVFTNIFDKNKTTQGVKIVPNPANNLSKLVFEDAINGDANIEIHTADGRLMHSQQLTDLGNKKELSLTTDGLVAGIYFVQVKTAGKVFAGKFLVE